MRSSIELIQTFELLSASSDRRVVVLGADATLSPESPTHAPHRIETLLSPSDLDYGSRFSGAEYNLNGSSESDELNIIHDQELADCEEAEYLLEQSTVNKENEGPPTTSWLSISPDNSARTGPTYLPQMLPRTGRRQLRRPKQETIDKVCGTKHPNQDGASGECYRLSLPRNELRINPSTSRGYWLGAKDTNRRETEAERAASDNFNSTGNTEPENWEALYDSFYSHPSETPKEDTDDNAFPDQFLSSGEASASSIERVDSSRNRNALRAGTYIAENLSDRYRADDHRNRHYGYPCDIQRYGPYKNSLPYSRSARPRSPNYPRQLATQVSRPRQPPITRRRYARRIQDDDTWRATAPDLLIATVATTVRKKLATILLTSTFSIVLPDIGMHPK